MDAYIRAGGLPEFYRCDIMNLTDEDWYRQGEKHIGLGIYCMTYGLVCQFLYLPCLVVFLQQDVWILPVYRILFWITICDFFSLMANSVFAGYFFIIGAVYCNFPHFMYIWGSIEMGCWTGCCAGCFVLVFSRLVDLWNNEWHDVIFKGKRITFSFLLVLAYQLYFVFYAKPCLFNSVYLTWIFDPLVFTNGSMFMKYASIPTTLNNSGTVSLTLVLYLIFIITFIYKLNKVYNFSMGATQKQMFIQSSIVCLNNLILALIYVAMQWVKVTTSITFMGLIMWQLSSGSGVMVFLGVNRTIRQKVLRLLFLSKASSGTIGGVTKTANSAASKHHNYAA